jgi:hypothetical protein
MDSPLLDVVGADVSDSLDRVCLAFDLDLVALHGLLNCCTYVANPDVYTRSLRKSQPRYQVTFVGLS